MKKYILFLLLLASIVACKKDSPENLNLDYLYIGSEQYDVDGQMIEDISVNPVIRLIFSEGVDKISAENAISVSDESGNVDVKLSFTNQSKTVSVSPQGSLDNYSVYTLNISDELKSANGGAFESLSIEFKTVIADLSLESVLVNGDDIINETLVDNVPLDFEMTFNFSTAVSRESFENSIVLSGNNLPSLSFDYANQDKTAIVSSDSRLEYLSKYQIGVLKSLESSDGARLDENFNIAFISSLDSTPKFPLISDEELLTKVQEQTFKYFWDYAHPESGMARERLNSGDIVTTGGSGFALMTIIVGIERGFISRAEGLGHLKKMIDFFSVADRHHGVWPHWLDGKTGKTVAFGAKDNGGDLVETAFAAAGMIAVKEYLEETIGEEKYIIDKIELMLSEIEWDWYTRGGQNVLYWHWSPEFGWDMNMQISGYNESLIVYVLAASSNTHGISTDVYHQGWARNGGMINGKDFYGVKLPLGYDYGGPLFLSHYSFLGMDPRNLSDVYANYMEQGVNHSKINQLYCADNPKGFTAYSDVCWGLTASDNHNGYSAHSPTNDLGVITPTAALSSIVYTPEESMEALKFFYYTVGDRLWGEYGFYDAFNFGEEWVADSYLAIDQGPIIIMIENYRSSLIWDLFMKSDEAKSGLTKLGFTY